MYYIYIAPFKTPKDTLQDQRKQKSDKTTEGTNRCQLFLFNVIILHSIYQG